MENVLTELAGAEAESVVARASLQAHFFREVIEPNMRLLEPTDDDAKALVRSYVEFVGVVSRILLKRRSTLLSKQASFFTTNVDMAFEVAMELLEVDYNDGFAGKLRPRLDLGSFGTLRYRQGLRYEYRSEIPVLNLMKLHGSAGWRLRGGELYFDHRLRSVRSVKKILDSAHEDLVLIESPAEVDSELLRSRAAHLAPSVALRKFATAYGRLQIVNPEKTKFASTVLNKTYYELLRRFANELEKENTALLVHGFSFRDEHILDLVLRAAAANPTLQVVVFCYSRQSHDDIESLFPPERVKNGNICLVQPAPVSDAGGERRLSLDVLVDDFLRPMLTDRDPIADHIIELRIADDPSADA
ncbi:MULTISPECIES: SIR2 family protein [Microbacterium]|uniref:SIR2 family protein n=1 Tax=Microbacterium TaxID=33882 RepID=UPI0014150776|nr:MULTISPECIES: SIR2 family protein [Microbacterium]